MRSVSSEAEVVAVTGATGFLGRHLVPRLRAAGVEVLEISRPRGHDIRRFETLDALPPFRALVHLAARTFVPDSYRDSLGFFETNVTGTIHCLELCRRHKARLVFASSYVYGRPRYLPVDEDHPTSAWNPYAATKLIGEELAAVYARDFGIPATVLRFFNIFGAGQAASFLIPTIVRGLRSGNVSLKDSAPRRDYVYIADVVSAIESALTVDAKGFRTYNVGTGRSHSVAEVVATARGVLGSEATVEYLEQRRTAEVDDVVADIGRIGAELGWSPRFDLAAGLTDMLGKEE